MKIISVGKICYETYPCMHHVEIENDDGEIYRRLMGWFELVDLAKELKYDLSKECCYELYKDKNPPNMFENDE